MNITLQIEKCRLYGYHGVLEQENAVGANFYVSLEASIECLEDAYINDQINGTVSYAQVIDCIREEMKQPSKLLENLAYRIGKKLMNKFTQIKELTLKIEKENPPIKAQCEAVGIKIHLLR